MPTVNLGNIIGPPGPKGDTGPYHFEVNEAGELILYSAGDTAPNYRIDENGHLLIEDQTTVDLGNVVGDPGKSAYEFAQDGGYTGTEEEFTEKLTIEYPSFDNLRVAAPVNLLDNSDFTNPVNQRNVSIGNTPDQYFIDRWKFNRNTDDATYQLVPGTGINFGAGTWLSQFIPLTQAQMDNKTYTIAVWLADGTVWVQPVLFTAQDSYVSAPWNNQGFGTWFTNESWRITLSNLPACTIKHIALYEGEYTAETLPEYRLKGYAAELAECQRYYRDIYLRGASGFLIDANKAVFNLDFIKMRITNPTVQVIAGDNVVTPEGYFPVLSDGAYFDNNCCVVLKVDNSFNFPVFKPIGAFFGHIALSADL